MNKHVLMYMNTFMCFPCCFTCVTCVTWDLIITVSWKTFCLWTVCQEIFRRPLWVKNYIQNQFFVFEAILTLFLSSQHLVYDSVGRIVKSKWFTNAKSVLNLPCEDVAAHNEMVCRPHPAPGTYFAHVQTR